MSSAGDVILSDRGQHRCYVYAADGQLRQRLNFDANYTLIEGLQDNFAVLPVDGGFVVVETAVVEGVDGSRHGELQLSMMQPTTPSGNWKVCRPVVRAVMDDASRPMYINDPKLYGRAKQFCL